MNGAQRAGANARDVFQALSYLQYPMMLIAVGYAIRSVFAMLSDLKGGVSLAYGDWNHVLLYAGIGIGLSSLQDPSRTQNAMSRRIWQDPVKGRWMLVVLAAYTFGAMAVGLAGAYLAETTVVNQLSLGLLALGLGLLGMLKTAIDMREQHRLDRQPAPELALAQEDAA